MVSKIRSLNEKHFETIKTFRRHLHMHPELSFQEKETGIFIAEVLKTAGIKHSTGWAENGVVAIIEGKKTRRNPSVIALRADTDALPIQEMNDVSYRSKNTGVMHACGHDVHSASLLGSALILHETRDHFSGTCKLIFQPGEERLPGGASLLIKEGILKNPQPFAILGQHVHPPLDSSKVGFRAGKYMASADEIYLTIHGKGGHAGLPQDVIDPVLIASQTMVALQEIVSRKCDPLIPCVLSFGKINSVGGATNIIPNQVKLEGTFRTMDEDWRREAHEWITKITHHVAEANGGYAELDIKIGYPCLVNDPSITNRCMNYAKEFLGKRQVVELKPRMTAEDFAYYSQQIPACFYRLGTGNNTKGINSPVHTDTFDIDEDCLAHSSGLMAYIAIRKLGG